MGDASAARERTGAAERGLAHDLRNLLTVIDGHAQLARASLPEGHPAREDIDEVVAATSRAQELAVTWLQGPGAAAAAVVAPLDDLVGGVLPLLRAATGPDVGMEVRLDARRPVRLSRLGLERVLLNLCINAREAMPRGGTIAITTASRADGSLEVAVRDTGTGLDPAVVHRLSDPDAQLPGTASGRGLGLAISRALLEEAGGSLEIESAPGTGTTMRGILPAA